MRSFLVFLALTCTALSTLSAHAQVVHHVLEVRVDVKTKSITVKDRITLPQELAQTKTLTLHRGLNPTVAGKALKRVEAKAPTSGSIDFDPQAKYAETFALPNALLSKKGATFEIQYSGPIAHLPTQSTEGERSFSASPGVIDDEGVYLSGQSFWFPRFKNERFSYDLSVNGLPKGWSAFSAGEKEVGKGFQNLTPIDDIHLVAGPYTRFEEKVGEIRAIALLRSNDRALANKYLSVTERYLKMYEALIGPYPYKSFALVENFWETGYGMPAFTLLGPKIIRFPFILHSSYPHELLHNWFGNGVFLSEDGGNWCEGLTAYLADQLVQSQRGKGAEYRRRSLERYRDFGRGPGEFPLSQFRSRTDNQSEAIGYAKWSMVLHTLRQSLGDEAFTEGLRTFYKKHRFERASFDDLKKSFESASSANLDRFFERFVHQKGAPDIVYSHSQIAQKRGGKEIAFTVTLEQRGTPFPLAVPFYVTTAKKTQGPYFVNFQNQRSSSTTVMLESAPHSLSIDPRFDVFRVLHPLENAPTLSGVMGAKRKRFILPTFAKGEEKAWLDFAKSYCRDATCTYEKDTKARDLRADETVIILGHANRLRAAAVVGSRKNDADYSDAGITIFNERFGHAEHSVAMSFRHPNHPKTPIAFIAAPSLKAIKGLARKLPHYGKYSALVFRGDAPDNVAKGIFENQDSPFFIPLAEGASLSARRLPKEKALAELPPIFNGNKIKNDVVTLSQRGRGPQSPGLKEAKRFVNAKMNALGLEPPAFAQKMHARCLDNRQNDCALVYEISGKNAELAPLLLGAHIDHLAKAGQRFPGANDNASGVATLVAVSKILASEGPHERPIHIAFFDGEEAKLKGSKAYVELSKSAKVLPYSVVNLDMVGATTGEGFFVLGHESATDWMHIFHGVSFVSGVKTTLGAKGLAASDHLSFLDAGVPAIHLFGGPVSTYHKQNDSASKVKPSTLRAAADLTLETSLYLANRKSALKSKNAQQSKTTAPQGERKVSLGVVPDFAYQGQGVRLTGVQKGSPAAKAGLQKGDIIIAIDGKKAAGLRALANTLRSLKANDTLTIRFRRGSAEQETQATLVSR